MFDQIVARDDNSGVRCEVGDQVHYLRLERYDLTGSEQFAPRCVDPEIIE